MLVDKTYVVCPCESTPATEADTADVEFSTKPNGSETVTSSGAGSGEAVATEPM